MQITPSFFKCLTILSLLFYNNLACCLKKTVVCFDRKLCPIPPSALSVHNLQTLGSDRANTVCTQCTMINPQIVYWRSSHSEAKITDLLFLASWKTRASCSVFFENVSAKLWTIPFLALKIILFLFFMLHFYMAKAVVGGWSYRVARQNVPFFAVLHIRWGVRPLT